MEDEVRHILRDAVEEPNHHVSKLGTRIAARFVKVGLTTELPELTMGLKQTITAGRRRRYCQATP